MLEVYALMKRIKAFICVLFLLSASLFGCEVKSSVENKLKIVATIFPAYDFAHNIAGDSADVSLLLPPGVEAHSYEPTPKDMVLIQNCDIFICNGGESESWIDEIIDSLGDRDFTVIKMLDCAGKLLEEDEPDGAAQENKDGDDLEYDEHIWTSPVICADICNKITDAMCKRDAGNSSEYKDRCIKYSDKLLSLSRDIEKTVEGSKRKELIFGDRFPFKYFADEYGLRYYAAFPGCSTQTEPSAAAMARLIEKTNADKIPAIFYIEMSNRSVADTLSEATGAKELLFHSCHNLTRDELERGEDYLSLMRKNLENLKIALN